MRPWRFGLAGTIGALATSLLFCQRPDPRAPSVPLGHDSGALPDAASGGRDASLDGSNDRATTGHLDDDPRWAPLHARIEQALDAGKMPGCVVVVGRRDEILLERAYGSRALLPSRTPMTLDTVFDLASLTKPLATATSVMRLVEQGALSLDARASTVLPELAKLPPFTIRQLLLHTSGLPAGLVLPGGAIDRRAFLQRVGALSLKHAPGSRFLYSDVGFGVLQDVVERVAQQDFASFCRDEVFTPLHMHETRFLPHEALRARAAPTERRDGGILAGDVHDPTAFALGGVAGHAGLFSTGNDVARFAQMMLSHGKVEGADFLSEALLERFTARHETPKGPRALGWDIESPFAKHRSPLYSVRAFGHGGYTGTALWIDPERDLFLVFLSNRVHPDGRGEVNPLISELGTLAVRALEVLPGIDALRNESFARLQGLRVGLITNESARTRDGQTTLAVLRSAPGVKLAAIFTPEHGLSADREGKIKDAQDGETPIYSLYGERFSPSERSLDGLDALVFDLQDAGVRFYTYASTMKRAMKLAAARHLRFLVLDRPNPLGGLTVEGPVLAPSDTKGFLSYHALPLQHGMTMGELARLFQAEEELALPLEVVPLSGWRRQDTFDRTGLVWRAPSPNLRTTTSVKLYPAIGLLESTNISVGRGTDEPFEVVAAPWLDAPRLILKLRDMNVPGVRFSATETTPRASVYASKRCRAIRVTITDETRYEPIRTGLALAHALHEVHPTEWDLASLSNILRHPRALEALREGQSFGAIRGTWASELEAFRARRNAVLLYR
jgi:uncharacterized protein YbbC (DUF1343 family)